MTGDQQTPGTAAPSDETGWRGRLAPRWAAMQPWRRRLALWVAVGLVSVTTLVMREIDVLLRSIETTSDQAFDTSVLTRFRPNFFDTGEIATAWRVWNTSELGQGLVIEHLLVDVGFMAGLAFLLWVGLGRVGVTDDVRITLVTAALVLDLAENAVTFLVLVWPGDGKQALFVIPLVGLLKWFAYAATVGWGLLMFLNPAVEGDASLDTLTRAATRTTRRALGHGQPATHPGMGRARPRQRLRMQIVVVGLFGALVALPGGGPLDQLPDVIRSTLDPIGWTLVVSTAALLVFAVAVFASARRAALLGIPANHPDTGQVHLRDPGLGFGGLAKAVVVLAAAITGAGLILDGFGAATLTLPIVLAVLGVVGWLVHRLRPRPPVQAWPIDVPDPDAKVVLRTWSAGLAAAVVLFGSLGLVRAASAPLVLHLGLWWGLWLLVGVLGALGAGVFAELLCRLQDRPLPGPWDRIHLAFLGVLLLGWVLLTGWPLPVAPVLAATGVVALTFGTLALALGEVERRSETHMPWSAVSALRPVRRTPYVALAVLVGLSATQLDRNGGYHDVPVRSEARHTHLYTDLQDAFDTWLTTADGCAREGVRPMVLVAAPGGGIRAAYWTASALDALSADCPSAVFAVSGVSGGSVGTVAWSLPEKTDTTQPTAPPGTPGTPTPAPETDAVSGRAAAAAMSQGGPLSAAMAGLLTRDLPHAFVPFTGGYADRGALLADGWDRALTQESALERRPSFDDLATPRAQGWTPVLTLNGSSVSDGCRVLATNLAQAAIDDSSCLGLASGPGSGPVSGAVDARTAHQPNGTALAQKCAVPQGIRRSAGPVFDVSATNAALLSARFPVVSPAGTIRRCVQGRVTPTYVVDGGYIENTGMLTLLQLWEDLAPIVRAHNAQGGVQVVPWVVEVDNHYRSRALRPTVRRVAELTAPLVARLNASSSYGSAALEQQARHELAAFNAGSGSTASGPVPDGYGGALVVIAPRNKPTVNAPLGWVLSDQTRAELDAQLAEQIDAPSDALARLLTQLRPPTPAD